MEDPLSPPAVVEGIPGGRAPAKAEVLDVLTRPFSILRGSGMKLFISTN